MAGLNRGGEQISTYAILNKWIEIPSCHCERARAHMRFYCVKMKRVVYQVGDNGGGQCGIIVQLSYREV